MRLPRASVETPCDCTLLWKISRKMTWNILICLHKRASLLTVPESRHLDLNMALSFSPGVSKASSQLWMDQLYSGCKPASTMAIFQLKNKSSILSTGNRHLHKNVFKIGVFDTWRISFQTLNYIITKKKNIHVSQKYPNPNIKFRSLTTKLDKCIKKQNRKHIYKFRLHETSWRIFSNTLRTFTNYI